MTPLFPPSPIAGLLAEWGLSPEEAPVDAPPISKNRTLLCQDRVNTRFLVKSAHGPEPLGVVHEGRVLAALAPWNMGSPLLLPRTHAFDAERAALVLHWEAGAESLHAYHRRTRAYPVTLGRALGRALAHLHARSHEGFPEPPAVLPRGGGIGAIDLFVYLKPDAYAQLSPAGLAFLALVQADTAAIQALFDLRNAAEGACWLHGDLKQANVLRLPGRPARVMLVDWELSAWGDPGYDLGQLVASYVIASRLPAWDGEVVAPEVLSRFLAALFGSYRASRRGHFPVPRGFSLGVMRWAGVGVLIYAHTRVRFEGAFDPRARRLAELGLDLLRNPHRWAWDLLEVAP